MNKIFCGIDLGTRSSAICVIDEKKMVLDRWEGRNSGIVKEFERFIGSGDIYVVIEAGPLAESVCEAVEKLGAKEILDTHRLTQPSVNV